MQRLQWYWLYSRPQITCPLSTPNTYLHIYKTNRQNLASGCQIIRMAEFRIVLQSHTSELCAIVLRGAVRSEDES